MGSFEVFVLTIIVSAVLTSAQENSLQMAGAPCSASFHCWRTEPVDESGQPLSLSAHRRGKRLEIGANRGRGAKCRCIEGSCRLFHIPTESFFACEEF